MQSYLQKENRTLGDQFPGHLRVYRRARVAMKKTTIEATSEGSRDITFSNLADEGSI